VQKDVKEEGEDWEHESKVEGRRKIILIGMGGCPCRAVGGRGNAAGCSKAFYIAGEAKIAADSREEKNA